MSDEKNKTKKKKTKIIRLTEVETYVRRKIPGINVHTKVVS